MEYRPVGDRCAVAESTFAADIPIEIMIGSLTECGFRVLEVDLIKLARSCVGQSVYQRGANPSLAPTTVDCSSFTKWLYAQCGIWLPRRSVQQREVGTPIGVSELIAGDLVFTSGPIDYYRFDQSDGVGHVGIATSDGTIIHAANSRSGVIETSVDDFVSRGLRGIRRIISERTLTIQYPPGYLIETSSDLFCIGVQLAALKQAA